jgi:hypothetical protein
LKRQAVFEKHKDALEAMVVGKQKGIRFRKYFLAYVRHKAYLVFADEGAEYRAIGKAGREYWTDFDQINKTFKKGDPILPIVGEIMSEFGCFDY